MGVGEGIRVACFVLPIHLRPEASADYALSTEAFLAYCVSALLTEPAMVLHWRLGVQSRRLIQP